MADYTLRYSGQEIDSVCDKVTDMSFSASEINKLFSGTSPLRMYWGWHQFQAKIEQRNTSYHFTNTFTNILPEDAPDRDDIFVIVGCDFGGEVFSEASVSYKKSGKDVDAEVLITPGGQWTGVANELKTYTMNMYCLVVYIEGGGWHVA